MDRDEVLEQELVPIGVKEIKVNNIAEKFTKKKGEIIPRTVTITANDQGELKILVDDGEEYLIGDGYGVIDYKEGKIEAKFAFMNKDRVSKAPILVSFGYAC